MSEPIVNTSAVSKQSGAPPVNTIVAENHHFEIPTKLIKTPSDMKIWEKSETYFEYVGFILAINEAIKGKSNSQGSVNLSKEVTNLLGMIQKLDAIIDKTPPIKQPQRFGNQAFRTWFQTMKNESLHLLQAVITKPQINSALPEIVTYLIDSFGNATRIDYGTGHEISFVMFLCSLFKIGFLKDQDKVATGCCVFPHYLDLARKLQKTYRMEPAGSHGVWSLDDYQFVPFIWGSSQLFAHPNIEPKSFLHEQILNDYGEDYMFLTCIKYIKAVKTGPFAEHSNQLWSISGVSSWSKINGGLVKMYRAEVLSKFPVVQHIVFGSLFTLRPMEHCTGMMTPKYPMMPPPVPSPPSSISSEKLSGSSSGRSENRSGSESSSRSGHRSEGTSSHSKESSPSSPSKQATMGESEESQKSSKGSTASPPPEESAPSESSEKGAIGDRETTRESVAESVRFGSVQISEGEGYSRKETKL